MRPAIGRHPRGVVVGAVSRPRIGVPVFRRRLRRAATPGRDGDHRPVPGVAVGAAAAAAPGAVGGGLRLPARHRVLRRQAGSDRRRGLRGRHVLHDVQAHPVRRAPGQRLHQHAVRGAGRRRHLRHAVARTSGSATRRPRASRAPRGRSPWSTPSAWPPATTRPVLQVNYEYYDNQTPDGALDLVTALQAGERPHPTRGAPLTDFRTVELEIAGIFTDLAGAGGGADRVGADAARIGAGRADRPTGPGDAGIGRVPAAAGEEMTAPR